MSSIISIKFTLFQFVVEINEKFIVESNDEEIAVTNRYKNV